MRTRTRFAILFACIGLAVMAIGVAAIYEALGLDSARRMPAEAEALLGAAAKNAIDPAFSQEERLEAATGALIAARALLTEGRVMSKDAVVRLALEVAAILAAVLVAAALAFFLLSRLITKGLVGLAAGALAVQGDRARRFPRSPDPDLDTLAKALNDLLDLAADQERRLGEAAKLEGWREVASFLAHQLKNPLAALRLAAENGSLALGSGRDSEMGAADGGEAEAGGRGAGENLAGESLRIVSAEAKRLSALIDRFRDLAPQALESRNASSETDLGALLASLAARAEIAGASVSMAGDHLGIKVAADRGLLEQALWNLFANSIEAGAGRVGGPVRIEVGASVEGGEALVVLTDSNGGLDPALLSRLGRERVTTKAEGTGLGLILVRRILAAQGGSLELFATDTGGLGARARVPLAGRMA
jgi:signal transduction histidine kinase